MIQIYSSELFLREKDKNCVNSDQYTEYFEDIWGSKVGSIEIPESYITCLFSVISQPNFYEFLSKLKNLTSQKKYQIAIRL